jgi:hypothetical protein
MAKVVTDDLGTGDWREVDLRQNKSSTGLCSPGRDERARAGLDGQNVEEPRPLKKTMVSWSEMERSKKNCDGMQWGWEERSASTLLVKVKTVWDS